jgi:multiple sugar transport system ATP-binding protein
MTLGDRVVVMRDGITQQAGAALEIYHRPTNRFVAGFLGSPPMNFFEGRLIEDAGRLFFDEGSGRLPVPAWAEAELRPHVGEALVLGVRPEAIADKAHARFECTDNSLMFKVTLVQPLGDKMDVYLATETHPRVVAHVDAYGGVAAGQQCPMFIDLGRIHFFEAGENGKRIANNASRDVNGLPV